MKVIRAALLFCLLLGARLPAEDWPWWRGPSGNGVSGESTAPVRWTKRSPPGAAPSPLDPPGGTSEGAGENIAWRVEPPGSGYSSPIVWGSHLFLTAAEN